jgi:hypothetical protein
MGVEQQAVAALVACCKQVGADALRVHAVTMAANTLAPCACCRSWSTPC